MVSLWNIFAVFSKIGAFTIGGGYAMIPLIQNELGKRGWISEEELPDIIALAQSAPGILAVNVSIFAGYRSGYQDNPVVVRIFKGIRPVVVSLIVVPMVNMARKNNTSVWAWLLTGITLVLVAFLQVSPIWILLVLIVLATAYTYYKERRTE